MRPRIASRFPWSCATRCSSSWMSTPPTLTGLPPIALLRTNFCLTDMTHPSICSSGRPTAQNSKHYCLTRMKRLSTPSWKGRTIGLILCQTQNQTMPLCCLTGKRYSLISCPTKIRVHQIPALLHHRVHNPQKRLTRKGARLQYCLTQKRTFLLSCQTQKGITGLQTCKRSCPVRCQTGKRTRQRAHQRPLLYQTR